MDRPGSTWAVSKLVRIRSGVASDQSGEINDRVCWNASTIGFGLSAVAISTTDFPRLLGPAPVRCAASWADSTASFQGNHGH